MNIAVNGKAFDLGTAKGDTLGEALAAADDMIEKSGGVIIGITVDGVAVDAESYSSTAGRPLAAIGSIEISAEPASTIRVRALETLLELISLVRDASESGEESDWQTLRAGAIDLRDAFAGLFAADELSFVQGFSALLERAVDPGQGSTGPVPPSLAFKAEIKVQAERLLPVFRERLAELLEPEREMHSASALFTAQEAELAELPVFLQTGKEDRAMSVVLYFIEVFNKVIRLIPELKRKGLDTDSLQIQGQALADFYASFNGILRELTGAFENKDAVLIGDLAEYEVLPRMKSFFSAMEEALPSV